MAVPLGGRHLLEDAEGVGQALPSGGDGSEQSRGEEDPGDRGRIQGVG